MLRSSDRESALRAKAKGWRRNENKFVAKQVKAGKKTSAVVSQKYRFSPLMRNSAAVQASVATSTAGKTMLTTKNFDRKVQVTGIAMLSGPTTLKVFQYCSFYCQIAVLLLNKWFLNILILNILVIGKVIKYQTPFSI